MIFYIRWFMFKNIRNRTQTLYRVGPRYIGQLGAADLLDRIERSSSLTRGDLENVLTSLIDETVDMLMEGGSTSLGNLGRLHLTASSEGAKESEDLSISALKRIHARFTASKALRDEVQKLNFCEWGKGMS